MSMSIAIAVAVALTGAASAHEFKAGDLVIDHPWSRTTPPGAPTGAGYVTITNTGSEPDTLIGGSAEVSEGFELHSSEVVDGVARMRPVEGGVLIAPGERVTLKPGGTHAMLTGLKTPIAEGESFAGTLVFERTGKVPVEFSVEGFGGRPEPAAASHEEHVQ